jgi:hypothetical protein
MKEWEIWSEGYAVSGNSSGAHFHGQFRAETFDEAVGKLNEESVRKYGKPSAEKGTVLDGRTMKPFDDWRIWGCKLFDNEADARKSFG